MSTIPFLSLTIMCHSPVDFEVILYSDKTIVYRGTGIITDTLIDTSKGINFKLSDEDDATRIVTSDAGFKPSSCKNLFSWIKYCSFKKHTNRWWLYFE